MLRPRGFHNTCMNLWSLIFEKKHACWFAIKMGKKAILTGVIPMTNVTLSSHLAVRPTDKRNPQDTAWCEAYWQTPPPGDFLLWSLLTNWTLRSLLGVEPTYKQHSQVASLERLEQVGHPRLQSTADEDAVVEVVEEDGPQGVRVTWNA